MSGYTRKHVLFILKSGISYRMLSDFPNINSSNAPHWASVYKFFKKLVKYNIIHNTFKQTVNKYLLKSNNNVFLTDTSLIANKGGCDKKTYNPQLFILLCKINNYCNEIKTLFFITVANNL